MRLPVPTIVAIGGLVAGAFVLGRTTVSTPGMPPQATAVSAPLAPPSPRAIAIGGSVTHLDDADVRRIRDEVVAAMAGRPRGATESTGDPAAPAPSAPSPEQLAAEDDAVRIIDDAIATGRWTDANASALRVKLAAMPADASEAMARQLAVAVNAGKLRFDLSGPPL